MKELKVRYGKIPGYRDPRRKSWGFEIEGGQEAWGWGLHTAARRSARRVFKRLEDHAAERGYSLKLTLDPGCGLGEDLRPL
jgi:hypothetical protein